MTAQSGIVAVSCTAGSLVGKLARLDPQRGAPRGRAHRVPGVVKNGQTMSAQLALPRVKLSAVRWLQAEGFLEIRKRKQIWRSC